MLVADTAKMYWQIRVQSKDVDFQRIVWRQLHSKKQASLFKPATCIYEAARSISKYSNIIARDFYADDLMTGTDTVGEAKRLCTKLTHLLGMGGFDLRKGNEVL